MINSNQTWISLVNFETKVQSKEWIDMHSPNKVKKFKQALSERKQMVTPFLERKQL
jgi:hypothetical protein